MYEAHLFKAPSKIGETGVFTNTAIPAGVPIMEFRGDLFTRETLKHESSQIVQIGPDMFLGPSGTFDDYINHSCNPNCTLNVVGRRAILLSLYVIPADAELTWDYSTTSTDSVEQWSMSCKCGEFSCRQTISGFHNLSDKMKENYIKKGMVPMFITNPIFR